MKILVVTGKLAAEDVKKAVSGFDVDVFVADVDIAAFVTPEIIKKINLSNYDLVLLPGNAKGNWKKLEEETGVKIRLGSIHAADLPKVLKNIDKIELSHSIPACRLLYSIIAKETIDLVNSDKERILYPAYVGDVVIGEGRMKVVAEIVDAPELEKEELISKIEYYLKSGADIIDIGIPIDCEVEKAIKSLKVALDCCNAVSIDTFDSKIIKKAVEQGVHMIMSVSSENIEVLDFITSQAVVVVSRDVSELMNIIKFARKKGKNNLIADCILDPFPNLFSSLSRYAEYRSKDKSTPILMGVGNVTELCDVDSVGINAVLSFIAEEIGVNALFTTEASYKTKGCIKELRTASYMARAAKLRKSPPKDFGVNLLVLKEKIIQREKVKASKLTYAKKSREFVRDPKGDFRIYVHGKDVVAVHDSGLGIIGDSESVVKEIIRRKLISRLDHAAYLGRELKKAEIAAKLEKSYIQDEDLNFGIYKD